MMKKKKVIISLLLAVCCALSGNRLTIQAEESWPSGPQIMGGSAIVMEANSGAVLYAKNAHEQLYPASITKIMTSLLAIENSKPEEKVTFSYDSVHKTEGSSIWRDVDEVMTMEQCLYALMLNSANECGYAIAEHVAGDYNEFVNMMNERAQELGCSNTHFNNPHGLPDEGHYTTCYDMALISREAIQNDTFRRITGTKRYDIPPTNKHPDEITYLTNHHKMLFSGNEYYYEYCIGGKTGYTEAAGSTLVSFAEKDGMTLICVVMQEEKPNHWTDSLALLDYCFENFQLYDIKENQGDKFKISVPESEFLSEEIFVDIKEDAAIVLPKGIAFSDATMEIITDNNSEKVAGTLQYKYGDRVVGTADIEKTQKIVEKFPFEAQYKEEGEEIEKVVHINGKTILLGVIIILLIVALGFGIYKICKNFYLIRYYFHFRKKEDVKNKVIRKKRNKRRRR